MTSSGPSTPRGPIADLNAVLSEVIDLVQDVKQAHRKVPKDDALHAVVDHLFDDLRSWARLLMEQDQSLGISPLATMPSVAGRQPLNLWRGEGTDDDVRQVVGEHLDRLAEHVSAALAEQDDAGSRAALTTVERQLRADRLALAQQ